MIFCLTLPRKFEHGFWPQYWRKKLNFSKNEREIVREIWEIRFFLKNRIKNAFHWKILEKQEMLKIYNLLKYRKNFIINWIFEVSRQRAFAIQKRTKTARKHVLISMFPCRLAIPRLIDSVAERIQFTEVPKHFAIPRLKSRVQASQ